MREFRSRYLSAFIFVLVSVAPSLAEEGNPSLRVGVIGPLTGPFAAAGNSFRNSIELAHRDRGSPADVKFYFEDDQLLPFHAVTAVKRLLTLERVNALVLWGTPTSLAVNSIAEEAKVPMVALSVADAVVRDKKFVMKHYLPAPTTNHHIVDEIRRRDIKTVALVVLENDAAINLKELFIKSNAATVVFAENFTRDGADFRTAILKIRQRNPDGVYLLLWSPQLSEFARQLRQSGYKGVTFGTQNYEDANEVRLAAGALDGSWFVGLDDSAASEYFRAYRSKYGSDPVAGGPNAYDVATMLIQGRGHPNLNEYLHNIKGFKGALGEYDATSNNDFALRSKLKCIRDGAIVTEHCE